MKRKIRQFGDKRPRKQAIIDTALQPRFPPPGKTAAEDTAAVMKFYKLPFSFPQAVLDEARALSAPGTMHRSSRPPQEVHLYL